MIIAPAVPTMVGVVVWLKAKQRRVCGYRRRRKAADRRRKWSPVGGDVRLRVTARDDVVGWAGLGLFGLTAIWLAD